MVDQQIDIELEKLNKKKAGLLTALRTLVKDHERLTVKIDLMSKESINLNEQLKILRSNQTKIVSLMDVQRIKQLIVDVKEKLVHDKKQLVAVEAFMAITKNDLFKTEKEIEQLTKIKNHQAQIYEFTQNEPK